MQWFRSPTRSWWLLFVAALLALGGTVIRDWGGVLWPGALLTVLGFVSKEGLEEFRRHREEGEARDSLIRRSTSITKGVGAATDAEFGVHRPLIDVPYQRRRDQDLLESLVSSRAPVLVVGHSMAGKTRMGAEVVRELLSDKTLVVPEAPGGLVSLLNEGMPFDSVIWLDDVERFLDGEGLGTGWGWQASCEWELGGSDYPCGRAREV